MRHACDYPKFECWLNDDWADPTVLTQIIVARQQPDGDIVFGVYLVNKACLGLKKTFYGAGYSRTAYRHEAVDQVASSQDLHQCSPQLAHQVIYGAIDYAARFGFKPQKDFRVSQYLSAPLEDYDEEYEIEGADPPMVRLLCSGARTAGTERKRGAGGCLHPPAPQGLAVVGCGW